VHNSIAAVDHLIDSTRVRQIDSHPLLIALQLSDIVRSIREAQNTTIRFEQRTQYTAQLTGSTSQQDPIVRRHVFANDNLDSIPRPGPDPGGDWSGIFFIVHLFKSSSGFQDFKLLKMQLPITAVFAVIPISFAFSRAPYVLRLLATVLLVSAALYLPLTLNLPINQPSTMVTAVLPFMVALVTIKVLLFQQKPASAPSSSLIAQFGSWCSEFMWFAVPLVKTNVDSSSSVVFRVFFPIAESAFWAAVKYALSPLLLDLMLNIASGTKRNNSVLAALFMTSICTGTWSFDVQNAVVVLFSWGRYGVMPFNNYPLLSSSLHDFWSHRYNLHIRSLLHWTVFTPAQSALQVSPAFAAMLSFIVSGLLHAFVAHIAFGHGALNAFYFFLIHGLLALVDLSILKPYAPAIFRMALTPIVLVLTHPLYTGLFVQAMPEWLHHSAVNAPANQLSELCSEYFRMYIADPIIQLL
jgi:hypothetical protein